MLCIVITIALTAIALDLYPDKAVSISFSARERGGFSCELH